MGTSEANIIYQELASLSVSARHAKLVACDYHHG